MAYTLSISVISVVVYTYGSVAILFRGTTKRLVRPLHSSRRFRFWFWISFNIFILINWSCVTAVFYLPQHDCVAAGDTASWWPWYNYCSQVYNVWAWSIWNIIAVFGNCYFIIADELDSTFVESEAIAVKRLRDEAATI